jgi:hypothetical protein
MPVAASGPEGQLEAIRSAEVRPAGLAYGGRLRGYFVGAVLGGAEAG